MAGISAVLAMTRGRFRDARHDNSPRFERKIANSA
jgi:hypothetical protein